MSQPSAPARSQQRLLRVQAASGLIFAFFLLVHLVNQALAVLGPAAYDGAQRALRRGYQSPPVEIALVLLPLLVHAAAGILRAGGRLRRRGQPGAAAPRGLAARLHRLSGLVLLVFFVGHVAATRGASFFYGVYPEFAGLAFTFRWVPAYFYPYYSLLAAAGVYHLVYGLGVALPVLGLRGGAALRRPRLLLALGGGGAAAVLAGVLALGGAFFPVGQPEAGPYARLLVRLGVVAPR